jgi:hypothetical protein
METANEGEQYTPEQTTPEDAGDSAAVGNSTPDRAPCRIRYVWVLGVAALCLVSGLGGALATRWVASPPTVFSCLAGIHYPEHVLLEDFQRPLDRDIVEKSSSSRRRAYPA